MRHKTKVKTWPMAAWLLAAWLLAACNSEEIRTDGGGDSPGDEVEFSFRMAIPPSQETALTPGTRAQTAEETQIQTVDILVFTQNGGTSAPFTYAYHVRGAIGSTGNPLSAFKARLKSSGVPVKIYLLANAAVPGKVAEPVVGATEASVKNTLTLAAAAGALPSGGIPMWGEYLFAAGIAPQYSREVSGIKMYRSLAKATVSLGAALQGRFAVTAMYVVRARDRVCLLPQAIDPAGLITGVNIPAGVGALAPVNITPVGASFYLGEDAGFATAQQLGEGTASKNHTAIVVAGKLDGGAETFHRVDVQQDGVYGRIVRNHHYRITLTGITREGASSLQAALDLEQPTLVYETKQYILGQGLTTIAFDALEQLSAAEKQIILAPEAGVKEIAVSPGEDNTQIQIARFAGGNVVGSFGQTATLSDVNATAEVVTAGSGYALRITSNQNPGTADLTDKIMLRTPTKMLLLDVVKKSSQTVGISAVVAGSLDPQKASFLSSGGTHTVQVTSSTDWTVESVPDWVSAKKINATTLQLSIAAVQATHDREHVLVIRNQMGQTARITAYQQYKLEWSAAYSRGGEHITDLKLTHQHGAVASTTVYQPATPAGTAVHFAAPAGDIGYVSNRVLSFTPGGFSNIWTYYGSDETYLFNTNPNQGHLDMIGDYYTYEQAKKACPPGWRLPTHNEVQTLIANMQGSVNKTLYITQNGTRIYFPMMWPYLRYLAVQIDSGSIETVNSNGWNFALTIPTRTRYSHANYPIYAAIFQGSGYNGLVRCVR